MLIKFIVIFSFSALPLAMAQQPEPPSPPSSGDFWQLQSKLVPFRLPLPAKSVNYLDLDNDGDPDVLRAMIGETPIQWIDDDDDMKHGDIAGDMDSDCLMIDRDRDGTYGGEHDLSIDWGDEDGDGMADLQVIADNRGWNAKRKMWGGSHYFVFLDTDHDGVLNYVDWRSQTLEAWDHAGRCDFFPDYNGKSIFMKAHKGVSDIKDLRYNWENPFLFFDPDQDGFTEMTIRFVDEGKRLPKSNSKEKQKPSFQYTGQVTGVYMGIDLDNDSRSENEQDFDMSLRFLGNGFDYSSHVHPFKSLRGLPASDKFFSDPRVRQLSELIYVAHEKAYPLIFQGEWRSCDFVFDEDDDCQRWERVDFYDPLDPFKVGAKNGGLDNNPQADVSGDRGEWDKDFSGKGNLYISPMDGRLHLHGAELGYWRIDQFAHYFQGWQGWRGPSGVPGQIAPDEPTAFATVKYTDTDANGFMDKVEYDLNGDQEYEEVVSLKDLGIDDKAPLHITRNMNYADYRKLNQTMACGLWSNAEDALKVAKKYRLNTAWYAFLMHPKTIQEKYSHGYWLSFYIYKDLNAYFNQQRKPQKITQLQKAYYGSNWKLMMD
ncbi:MAG: hypothetical protein V3V05_09690 [Pontiella sp.]